MKRVQEWAIFVIQIVVKLGLLGKYKLVSTANSDVKPVINPSQQNGLKTLENTILSFGNRNDELKQSLNTANLEIESLEADIIELFKEVVELQQKLSFMETKKKQAEDKLSVVTRQHAPLQQEVKELKDILLEAETLSEQLKVEMKKWRT